MKKKKILLIMFSLLAVIILVLNCIQESSNDRHGKKKKKGSNSNTIITAIETETTNPETINNNETNEALGVIEGSYTGDAEIILDQSDGTQQTTTTTTMDPDFIFTDVPAGEATITINPGDGSNSQTQTVQVNPGDTTLVNPFGSTTPMNNSLQVNIYDMGKEEIVDNDGKDNDGDDVIDESGESIIVFNDLNGDGKTTSDDFSISTIGTVFYSKEINVPIRRFSDGFPGITDRIEWFGVKYAEKIKAPKTGTYTFILVCDDGAKLSIGGNKMTMKRIGKGQNYFKNAYYYVQNPSTVPGFPECDGSNWLVKDFENAKTNTICDTVHAPAIYTCTVNLTAGQEYEFELKYYQGPKMHIACIMEVDIPNNDNDNTGTDGMGAVLFNTDLFK